MAYRYPRAKQFGIRSPRVDSGELIKHPSQGEALLTNVTVYPSEVVTVCWNPVLDLRTMGFVVSRRAIRIREINFSCFGVYECHERLQLATT